MTEQLIKNPAYRIETERLVVRCYQPSDAEMLAEAVAESVEHLKPWMPWAHAEPEPFQVKVDRVQRFRGEFDLGEDFIYAIFNKDESRLIGGTGLHTRLGAEQLEIGYWIHKDFTGQGLITESTAALVKVAFEIVWIHRIEIHCDPENLASASIPRKLGFTHEGTLHGKTRFLDRWRDTMIWGLLDRDYPKTPSCKVNIRVFDVRGNPLL
jgi:RimJ/RimL family protein N-acetyltransferase